ncbi:MAG: MBL fold metallo-hydrolase [Anaerolineales bacterium]|nr:MBL fold metallo-hydrolase [Anaerolineales bacterium]
MIQEKHYGEISRFDLSRNFPGRWRYWTTAYWVDGILVDTGCAHTAEELLRELSEKSLLKIVNTHSHEDHIGANGLLQRSRPGLEIFAHPLALPVLEDPQGAQPLNRYRHLFWGMPEPSHGLPLQDDQIIEAEYHQFQVIYTPGHGLDHICLYEPRQRWLFTGDLFVGGKDRALRADFDIWMIIDSLKRIAELPIDKLFPGCARVRDNPQEDIKVKIAYLEDLGGRALELHSRGWSTNSIARSFPKGPTFLELLTLGHFSRRSLVRSFLQKTTTQVDE